MVKLHISFKCFMWVFFLKGHLLNIKGVLAVSVGFALFWS